MKEKRISGQYLLNRIPKYGNGIDEADQLARFVAESYCDIVSKKRTFNGHVFRRGYIQLLRNGN